MIPVITHNVKKLDSKLKKSKKLAIKIGKISNYSILTPLISSLLEILKSSFSFFLCIFIHIFD